MPQYAWYHLEANAKLDKAEYLFEFEGRRFRLVRGGDGKFHTLYTVLGDQNNEETKADETVLRLCDLWSWEWRGGVCCVGGGGRGISSLTIDLWKLPSRKPCSMGPRGSVVDPSHLPGFTTSNETLMWAISLLNEARCSRSPFFRFLNYWKILELQIGSGCVKGKPEARAIKWIDQVPSHKVAIPDEVDAVLRREKVGLGKYLYGRCRNAVAHVTRQPTLQSNKVSDRHQIEVVLNTIARLAEHYIWDNLRSTEGIPSLRMIKTRKKRSPVTLERLAVGTRF